MTLATVERTITSRSKRLAIAPNSRRAQRRAVLAPEVDLVAGVEHRAIGVELPAPAPVPVRVTVPSKSIARQQRRARDARLRIGLLDARDGGRDVEIVEIRALDQHGQFARAKAAPPVRRRQCGMRLARRLAIFRRDIDDRRRSTRFGRSACSPTSSGASASASARQQCAVRVASALPIAIGFELSRSQRVFVRTRAPASRRACRGLRATSRLAPAAR